MKLISTWLHFREAGCVSSAGAVLKIRHQLKPLVEPGPITLVGVMPFPRYPGSNRSEVLFF